LIGHETSINYSHSRYFFLWEIGKNKKYWNSCSCMARDITDYCVAHECGQCCERGWNIFVTKKDLKNWEENCPEILKEVTSEVFDNQIRKLLKKKPMKLPDGTIRQICIFYDFKKKCLIHDVNPEICKKFTCTKHLYFIFRLFASLSHLTDRLTNDSRGEI